MSSSQLVTPNLNTAGNIGYCLAFVESAYGTGHLYPYAYNGWQATQYKHEDQNFPDGMYVPIWFSYMVGNTNEGHVAIRMPDGRVLSSPWQQGTTQAILPNIDELVRIYSDNGVHPLTYLGWSEDIAGVQVVETSQPLYTTTDIAPKQVLVTPGMHEWNLSLPDFETVCNNPFSTAGDNQVITVVATLVRPDFPQFTYYLENASSPVGWNTLDCTDYAPPEPVFPPVVPPLPAAPLPVKPSEMYTLVTTVMTFQTDTAAIAGQVAQATLKPGTYYIWQKTGRAYQLGTDNMHEPTDNWINIDDNIKPIPKPVTKILPSQVSIGTSADTTWLATYKPFHLDRTSDVYEMKQHWLMKEYTGKRKPVQLETGTKVNMVGTFVKNGVMFYCSRANNDEYFSWRFGVPMYDDDGNVNLVRAIETDPEKIEHRLSDYVHYWKDDFKDILDIIVRRKK